jgi:hypothetical protein
MFIPKILLFSFCMVSRLCNPAPWHKLRNTHLHPFYVSVTQIQENTKERTLEITCKIFTDDFEKDLRKDLNTHVDLLNPTDKPAMEKLVKNYVSAHLQISVDGKPSLLQYIGYEQDEEAVECYFQVSDIIVNKTVAVSDKILFDYSPEQVNIVHVTVRGIRKSIQLANPDSRASFDFQ